MKKIKQIGVYILVASFIAGIIWIPQSGVKAAAKVSQSKAVASAQKYVDQNIDDLAYGDYDFCWFQDVDLDGELEFIVETSGGSMNNYPQVFCKIKSNGSLEGIGDTEAGDLNLYYNKKTKKYVYLTVGRYKDGANAGNDEICELVNKNGELEEKLLFSDAYKYNESNTKQITKCYVNEKKVSKSTYKKSKNAYMNKLTKVKVHTYKISLDKWNSYSKQEKKNQLNKSYKAFHH